MPQPMRRVMLWRRWPYWGFVAAIACLAATPAQAADDASGRVEKIYNLLRFVSWPNVKSVRRVCLNRSDPLVPHMVALAGQGLGDDMIEVALLGPNSAMRGACDVVYAGHGSAAMTLPGKGQLLVGEGMAFAESGGTVALLYADGKIRFVINVKVARQSGLLINSQVLKMAARVIN